MKELYQKFLRLLGRKEDSVQLSENGMIQLTEAEKSKMESFFGNEASRVIKSMSAYVSDLNLKEDLAVAKREGESLLAELKTQQEINAKLSNSPEEDKVTVESNRSMTNLENKNKYLFAVPHEHYSLDKFWNKIALTKRVGSRTRAEVAQFKQEFNNYGQGLGDLYRNLQKSGLLPGFFKAAKSKGLDSFADEILKDSAFAAVGDFDYTDLDDQFGAYYYTRRQLDLLSYIRNIRDLSRIFPYHYGVQDGETLVSLFHGPSNSQAFQPGSIFSGSETFQGDVASVKGVMFSKIFEDMEKLETSYIGYLNTENSDPRKLSFIEYLMQFMMKLIVKEDGIRNVVGVRVEPDKGKSSFFKYGADGVLTSKERYIQENRVYKATSFNKFTPATIYDSLKDFAVEVLKFTGLESLEGFGLYFSSYYNIDFLDAYREEHKSDNNYDGDFLILTNMADLRLIPVPNMGQRQDVFIAPIGYFEILADKAGEEFAFYMDEELETTKIKSRFKRGASCYMPGRKNDTYQALLDGNPDDVTIFANRPYEELAADVTVLDAAADWYFRTIANTVATAITDISNAKEGVVYQIETGSTTNASTVAKAAKFANITAAWTPTAVDDYLQVIYDPVADLFWEYARVVGGTYTKNAALKSPEYTK